MEVTFCLKPKSCVAISGVVEVICKDHSTRHSLRNQKYAPSTSRLQGAKMSALGMFISRPGLLVCDEHDFRQTQDGNWESFGIQPTRHFNRPPLLHCIACFCQHARGRGEFRGEFHFPSFIFRIPIPVAKYSNFEWMGADDIRRLHMSRLVSSIFRCTFPSLSLPRW